MTYGHYEGCAARVFLSIGVTKVVSDEGYIGHSTQYEIPAADRDRQF